MSNVLIRKSVAEASVGILSPSATDVTQTEDRLDWDEAIGTPPSRQHGTIRVILEFTGRSKPDPVDDPWAE